jgi:4-hydroxybenzoate polyprenyltransferase
MPKIIDSLLKILVYSNSYIALAAALQVLLFQKIFQFPNTDYRLATLVFFSTFLVYNFHRLYKIKSAKVNSEKKAWLLKNFKYFVFLLSITIIILIKTIFELPITVFYVLIPLIFIALAYVVDFGKFLNTNKITYLKKVPFLKIFLIALVWCIVIVFLPFLVSESNANFQFSYIFLVHFMFFIIITLPFDVRDIETDKEKGIITLPNYLGLEKTKKLILVLSVFHVLLLVGGYFLNIVPLVFCVVAVLIDIVFNLFAQRNIKEQSEFFIGFFYDGLLILKALLILYFI